MAAVLQQGDVKVVEDVRVVGQEGHEPGVGRGGVNFRADEAHALADPVDVGIDR